MLFYAAQVGKATGRVHDSFWIVTRGQCRVMPGLGSGMFLDGTIDRTIWILHCCEKQHFPSSSTIRNFSLEARKICKPSRCMPASPNSKSSAMDRQHLGTLGSWILSMRNYEASGVFTLVVHCDRWILLPIAFAARCEALPVHTLWVTTSTNVVTSSISFKLIVYTAQRVRYVRSETRTHSFSTHFLAIKT